MPVASRLKIGPRFPLPAIRRKRNRKLRYLRTNAAIQPPLRVYDSKLHPLIRATEIPILA
ncbi:hypothetical protein SCWH03_25890 [Streptomyces pacificus]|uniref:Uncharacterized protein n=1 Tax=Streptomyces pacificus TaxID=2705029 RepID=A0A6A0AVK8_9ACTN|nr:hypothetical protein SCWH03_25890 [Streptomyces pacificus]